MGRDRGTGDRTEAANLPARGRLPSPMSGGARRREACGDDHHRHQLTPQRCDDRSTRPRAQGDLMTVLRHALLIGVPLVFSVLLWFHPMIGDYEGLRDVTTRFQVVHVGMVLAIPLLAIGIYGLVAELRGRAAAVGRFALIPFVVF